MRRMLAARDENAFSKSRRDVIRWSPAAG